MVTELQQIEKTQQNPTLAAPFLTCGQGKGEDYGVGLRPSFHLGMCS